MEESPYKAPVEQQIGAAGGGNWFRRLRRWSHGQPLAIFYVCVMAIGMLITFLAPIVQSW